MGDGVRGESLALAIGSGDDIFGELPICFGSSGAEIEG
jgi:hypothetical protein